MELDLGWRNSNNVDAFKLTGLYQWVWNIDGGFNWYAGVGGGLGSWNQDYKGDSNSGTFVFAAGELELNTCLIFLCNYLWIFVQNFILILDKYRSDNLDLILL